MHYTWSLKELYTDFDQAFDQDLEAFSSKIDELIVLANTLSDITSLESWLSLQQEINLLAMNLSAYTSLRMSTNTKDNDANRYYGQILNIFSKYSRPQALFTQWIASKKDIFTSWVNSSSLVKEHEFMLQELIDTSKYTLSEDVEEAISKMRINASSNWSQLQSHLTSTLTTTLNDKTETLSSIRNLAYSGDATIRKEAYDAEIKMYEKIEDSVAFALNSIKGEVNQLTTMRGYDSPLHSTLTYSRLSEETLNALIQAIENYLPTFRKYLQHKASLLGHTKGLPWYDMFAPYQTSTSTTYSVEDSKTIILDSFKTFSNDLYTMTKHAYEDAWIDFLPREGKRGGAFCMNLPTIKASRILSNFGGSISDIVTLAHELGHAYHGLMLEDNSILNTDYTMPVAETASTFCENIVFNAALETASNEEKIMLIENSLQDVTQITVDILSRFKFEYEVFERRNHEFLDANTLKSIMIKSQKDTYGDGLDESTYHPYMWICKGHYFSAGNSFYNFPYAFGGLFALGLYAQYEKEGSNFVPKYQELLKKTATASCEDVALMAGIDTTDVAFWEQSLAQIAKRIDLYIELTA